MNNFGKYNSIHELCIRINFGRSISTLALNNVCLEAVIIIITRIYSVFFSLLNYSFVCKYINVLVLAHRSKSLVAQEISSINNAFIILITIIKHCHASRPCMLFLCFGKGGLVLIPGLNAERRAIERSARKYSHVKVDAS